MDTLIVVVIIGGAYCILLFFDLFFKSCVHYPYVAFLHGTGLHIGFFHLRWHTTIFNSLIVKMVYGKGFPLHRILRLWFSWGVYVTLFLLPIATVFLLKSTLNAVLPQELGTVAQGPTLEPLIPGLNLPIEQIGYYSITMIICSIVHELGHALAATVEDVPLVGVGVNLMFVMPMAYCEMKSETLNACPVWKKLRIFCAGIWHNIVLAFVLYLLYISLPTIFSPMFDKGNTVTVSSIKSNSPLLGPKGLFVDDRIIKINDCTVTNTDDWYHCLLNSLRNKPAVCVTTDLVHRLDESTGTKHLSNGVLDCCEDSTGQSCCFEYLEPLNGIVQLPQLMCLPVRKVLENSKYCAADKTCEDEEHCIKPLLHNTTALIQIKRSNNNADVMYIGHPGDIFRTVHVSNYVPKYTFISSSFPECIETLLTYLVTFSLGLAVVNVLPCFCFDGQYIIKVLVNVLMIRTFKQRSVRNTVSLCITAAGTFFLVLTLVSFIWNKVI